MDIKRHEQKSFNLGEIVNNFRLIEKLWEISQFFIEWNFAEEFCEKFNFLRPAKFGTKKM